MCESHKVIFKLSAEIRARKNGIKTQVQNITQLCSPLADKNSSKTIQKKKLHLETDRLATELHFTVQRANELFSSDIWNITY